MSLYPTLDKERLKAFIADVPEDLWNDFKTYAYNGVPKAVEHPHSWSGTMEDFVFYIMEQWIKQHSAKPEQRQMTFAFAEVEDVKPGEKEWQQFLRLIDKDLAADLRKAQFLSYDGTYLFLGVPNRDILTMIEERFNDFAVFNHTEKCSVKVFGKILSLRYKIVKQ